MLPYVLYFDARDAVSPHAYLATPLALILLAVLLLRGRRRGLPPDARPVGNVFPWVLLAVGIAATLAVVGVVFTEDHAIRHALEHGTADVVEGAIESYRAAWNGEDEAQRFVVDGKAFRLPDDASLLGFHETEVTRAALREGLRVRVHVVHGKVARLEVEEGAAPAAPAPHGWEAALQDDLALALILAVAFGAGVSWYGWRWYGLAKRYRSERMPEGDAFTSQTLWVGGAILGWLQDYMLCMNVTVGPAGVGMVPGFPYLPFHPIVAVPWAAVESCASHTSLWGTTITTLRLAGTSVAPRFHGAAAARVAEEWRRRRGDAPAAAPVAVLPSKARTA